MKRPARKSLVHVVAKDAEHSIRRSGLGFIHFHMIGVGDHEQFALHAIQCWVGGSAFESVVCKGEAIDRIHGKQGKVAEVAEEVVFDADVAVVTGGFPEFIRDARTDLDAGGSPYPEVAIVEGVAPDHNIPNPGLLKPEAGVAFK